MRKNLVYVFIRMWIGNLAVKSLSWSGDHERSSGACRKIGLRWRDEFKPHPLFTLFTLFTPFFDSAKMHFHCKNLLVVKVRLPGSGVAQKFRNCSVLGREIGTRKLVRKNELFYQSTCWIWTSPTMLTARYLLQCRCKCGPLSPLFARFALFALFFDSARTRIDCKWISIFKVRTRSMNLCSKSIAHLFCFGKSFRRLCCSCQTEEGPSVGIGEEKQ